MGGLDSLRQDEAHGHGALEVGLLLWRPVSEGCGDWQWGPQLVKLQGATEKASKVQSQRET